MNKESYDCLRAALAAALLLSPALAASPALKPVHLTCDSLERPLGIDSSQPLFAWQLQDSGFGARQTAYRVEVASKPALLAEDKPDIWDSGRVTSDKSVGAEYAGPELAASTRYYWKVEVWDKDGKPYPASDVSWWETGLRQERWKARWIGYEDPEHRAVRKSGAQWITNVAIANSKAPQQGADTQHDFRLRFNLPAAVKHADLFVTGKDSAAAWINGKQVLETLPLPPWKQAPWKSYLRKDVVSDLKAGENLLAVGVTLYALRNARGERYGDGPNRPYANERLPLRRDERWFHRCLCQRHKLEGHFECARELVSTLLRRQRLAERHSLCCAGNYDGR
jgi:alpha-L-rhamnosidase